MDETEIPERLLIERLELFRYSKTEFLPNLKYFFIWRWKGWMQRYDSEEVFGLINVKELECEFAFISALQCNEPLLPFLLQEAHIFNLEFMGFQQLIFFFFSFQNLHSIYSS